MRAETAPIASLADLMNALAAREPRTLELQTSVACAYSITLPPGFALVGKHEDRAVLGFGNGDGIALTADNRVANLTVLAPPTARAICKQAGRRDMGRITLANLSVTSTRAR